jgi:hypothetical protein
MNTKPRRHPADGAFSTTHTLTSSDAHMLTPNVAQQRARGGAPRQLHCARPISVAARAAERARIRFGWLTCVINAYLVVFGGWLLLAVVRNSRAVVTRW